MNTTNRTTYNIDAFERHQKPSLKENYSLNKQEAEEILIHLSKLKDMLDNEELKEEGKTNIILNHLNSIGRIIANK